MASKVTRIPEADLPAGMGRGYNTPPPFFRRDKAAGRQAMFSTTTHTDHRQFEHDGRRISVTLYWNDQDKQGWGLGTEGDGVQVYAFGCPHTNKTETSIGRCLRRVTCKDCGHSTEIDSSG